MSLWCCSTGACFLSFFQVLSFPVFFLYLFGLPFLVALFCFLLRVPWAGRCGALSRERSDRVCAIVHGRGLGRSLGSRGTGLRGFEGNV